MPFGGGATYHHHHMLNFLSFAKKHFKRIVFFLYGFVLHLFMFNFFQKTDKQNFHNSTTYFSSSNGFGFQVKGASEARPATALQQLQTQHQVGRVGFSRRRVDPWGNRMFGHPKKKPGEGGNSNVFEDGSPRKLIWGIMNPF